MQLRASEAASRILMGFAKPGKIAIFAELGMSAHTNNRINMRTDMHNPLGTH